MLRTLLQWLQRLFLRVRTNSAPPQPVTHQPKNIAWQTRQLINIHGCDFEIASETGVLSTDGAVVQETRMGHVVSADGLVRTQVDGTFICHCCWHQNREIMLKHNQPFDEKLIICQSLWPTDLGRRSTLSGRLYCPGHAVEHGDREYIGVDECRTNSFQRILAIALEA